LKKVHDEESDERHCDAEVNGASVFVAAEQAGEKIQLCWLVDGKAGDDRDRTKEDDERVAPALGAVVLALRRQRLVPNEEVVPDDQQRIAC
jgi:hypothetical protein